VDLSWTIAARVRTWGQRPKDAAAFGPRTGWRTAGFRPTGANALVVELPIAAATLLRRLRRCRQADGRGAADRLIFRRQSGYSPSLRQDAVALERPQRAEGTEAVQRRRATAGGRQGGACNRFGSAALGCKVTLRSDNYQKPFCETDVIQQRMTFGNWQRPIFPADARSLAAGRRARACVADSAGAFYMNSFATARTRGQGPPRCRLRQFLGAPDERVARRYRGHFKRRAHLLGIETPCQFECRRKRKG